jgi:hypothetical protein
VTFSSKVNFRRDIVVLKSTALAVVPVVLEHARFSFEFSGHFQTEKLLILLRLKVGGPVVCEDERVGIVHTASQILFRVELIDEIVVQLEPALLPDEGPRVMHIFIVPGDELEEVSISP